MDWISVAASGLITIVVGVGLWAFLPRGVVLTRTVKTDTADTWRIKNDSPLPIRITSVRVSAPETVDLEAESILEPELPPDGLLGVRLYLDDETAEIGRMDWRSAWDQVVVVPGDTMTAHLPTNTSLYIDYRRAGWSGVFERRSLVIHGGA